jgi:hypothetical protein
MNEDHATRPSPWLMKAHVVQHPRHGITVLAAGNAHCQIEAGFERVVYERWQGDFLR